MPQLVLLAHAAATLAMTGVIWFVQVVHYPLFGGVGADRWIGYAAAHGRLTTLVVAPLMLVELATAVLLVLRPPADVGRWAAVLGLALVLVIWASTALLQVPAHGRLGAGFDADVHRGLVAGNWIRTLAWTARSALVLGMVGRAMQ